MTALNWKDSKDQTWSEAQAPRAVGGRYVISRGSDIWNVDHRKERGKLRRQLGFTYTAKEAKSLAQVDCDKALSNDQS